MPMAELPVIASWELHDPRFPKSPGHLGVDLKRNFGTLSFNNQTYQLTGITRITPTRLGARYAIGNSHGLLEAEIADDRTVTVKFMGALKATVKGTPNESAVQWIANAYKGSYDIAGAALALYQAHLGYVWSNEGSAFTDAHNQTQLYDARVLCCYEFVHLAAYLAGRQRTAGSGNPLVSGAAATVYAKRTYKVWDGHSIIPRNKIVVGVARFFNNPSGFYHVGVSLGDGRVISLSGGSNIHVELTRGQFGGWGYSQVLIGDYPWAQAQNDSAAPPPPP
jgi:hypothetical protein